MKKLSEPILDDIYPKSDINRTRKTAKGVILDENDNILLLHIKGEDMFGKRDHYELPGGGIESNENPVEALGREIQEELGYTIKDIEPIGIVSIEYNLLNRIDEGYFFSAKTNKFCGTSLLDYEKELFSDIIRVNIADIISFYDSLHPILVGKMIHKRDLIVIKEFIRKRKENGN